MAHTPETKAAAQVDLAKGETIRSVATKYKISSHTAKQWADEMKACPNQSPVTVDARKDRYESALLNFAEAALGMLTAQAELLSEKEYIRNSKTEDVLKHTEFLADRLKSFIRLTQGLPERDSRPTGAERAPEPLPGVAEPVSE